MRPPINPGIDLEQLLQLRAARRAPSPADRIQLTGLAPGVGVSSLFQPGPEEQAAAAAEQELRRRQVLELLMVRPRQVMTSEVEGDLRAPDLQNQAGPESKALEAERRRGARAVSHTQGRMRGRRPKR